MPVTPNGTTYTIRDHTTTDGNLAHWYMDDTRTWETNIPLLFFAHGSMGDDTSFQKTQWNGLRNWCMDNGWAVAEGMGGGTSHWGNTQVRDAYAETFTWVDSQINVGTVTTMGQSMGGLFTYWATTLGPFAHRVKNMVIHCGVTDILNWYDAGGNVSEGNLRYGVEPSGTKDLAQFTTKSAGHNPMDIPVEAWNGKRVLQMWGTADTTVLNSLHVLPWLDKYEAHTAGVTKHGDPSGHDPTVKQNTDTATFLSAIDPNPDPAEQVGVHRIRGMYVVANGGQLYPVN